MNKTEITYSRVWKVNKNLVVADTIEEAIELYKGYYEYPYNDIDIIEKCDYYSDNTALIKKN